jgi:hypothetical protein
MMPVSNIGTRVPLQIRRGADFSRLLTFTQGGGAALDLTGATLAAELVMNGQVVASFVITVNTPATSGTAQLSLSAAASLAIPPVFDVDEDSCARWGLELTDSLGKISALLYGPVEIFPPLVPA